MAKKVFIRFIGLDPLLTNAKVFVDGHEKAVLYVDILETLIVTEGEVTLFVKVYGYKSKDIVLTAGGEDEYLEVEYFAYNYYDNEDYSDRPFDRPVFRNDMERISHYFHEIFDAFYFLFLILPRLKSAVKEGMVRVRRYRKKPVQISSPAE